MTAPLLLVAIAASSIAGFSGLFGPCGLSMVETITPIVHGGSRIQRALDVTLHTLAATATSAAVGVALGAAGALLGAPWGASSDLVIAAAATGAALHELAGTPFPIPQLRRRMPDRWRTYFGSHVASALYGAGLGVGFLTYVIHATLVVVSVAAFASGSPVAGMLILAPFGLLRAASAAVAAWSERGARGASANARALAPREGARGPRASAFGEEDLLHRLAGIGRRPALANANGAVAAAVAFTAILQIGGRPMPVAEVASAALAIAFAWSAACKVARVREWWRVLPAYRLGPALRPTAIAAPALEAAVPALVLVRSPAAAGVLAIALLLASSAAVVRVRVLGAPSLRCGCFGTSERTTTQILLRTLALGVVAAVATTARRVGAPAIALPSSGQLLPFAMTLAGLVVIAAVAVEVRRSMK